MVLSITVPSTADLTSWRSSPNMVMKFRVCFCTATYFSGSANRLHQHVKALLAKQKCCFLLFDFRLVTGIDSSATFSFTQIKQIADQCGARLIFTGLTRDVDHAFGATRLISDHIIVAPNLDAALASCEPAIMTAPQPPET